MIFWSKELMMNAKSIYEEEQILFESATPGTYTLEIAQNGIYEVSCIAGGGGGSCYYITGMMAHQGSCGGASGSGFQCCLELKKGSYQIVVGSGGAGAAISGSDMPASGNGGNSSFGTCISYGGTGVNACTAYTVAVSTGGSTPLIPYTKKSQTFVKAGNGTTGVKGYSASGGAAVYGTYGKGGDVGTHAGYNGNSGYVKVIYKRR